MKRDVAGLAAREHDVAVIGAGIHGAVAACDAAQRGLSVALLDAADFGAGTSWNSLKTVHGGLRHLQRADVPGLRESAHERAALLRVAPDLVRPLTFLVPTYQGRGPSRLAFGMALRLDALLGPRGLPGDGRDLPPGRLLSAAEVLERVPGLAREGLTGGAEWTDAQVASTERLLLAFLHAATAAGATVANYVEATGIESVDGRVTGVAARDVLGGGSLAVRARVVVNATGPGLDAVLTRAGLRRKAVPLLHAANLVLGRGVTGAHAVGAKSGGRFLFLVPWQGRSILGTTYAAAPPAAAEFLAEACRAYPWADLRADDVHLVHRGCVPGAGDGRGLWTRSRVVDHGREDGLSGLLSLLSVKYTTARAIAEKAVDAAIALLGRRAGPCRTAVERLPRAAPEGPLAQRARHAAAEEAAVHLDDAVLRRLDLGTAGRPSLPAVEEVAVAMAEALGWDAGRRAAERDRLEAALRAVEAR